MAQTRQVDFYFDYISHNAYLAWHVLTLMAQKYDVALCPIPVLFAGFLKQYGQLGPAEIEPKLAWMNRNNLRKARILDIPYSPPKQHPFNPLLLLRLAAQPMPIETRRQLTTTLLAAVWADGIDPNDRTAIESYLGGVSEDPAALLTGASSETAKAQLKANTDEAIERSVFGVPSMLFGDEVFWGYDDLPYLEAKLSGEDPLLHYDSSTFDAGWVAARAAAAHRPR